MGVSLCGELEDSDHWMPRRPSLDAARAAAGREVSKWSTQP